MFNIMAYEYAVQFWPSHYRKAKEQGSHAEAMFGFLKNRNLTRAWWELSSRLGSTDLPPDMCVMDPLYLAAHLGFSDVVDFCLEAELPEGVAFATRGTTIALAKLSEKDISIIDYLDDKQRSALHVAIKKKNTEVARMLLSRQPHININLQDEDGNTSLLLAVLTAEEEQGLAGLLVECGADTEFRNKVGQTALLVAVSNGDENVWNLLLDRPNGSKIDAGGGVYPTALHKAAEIGERETVEQLVNLGANVDAKGGLYHTAFQAAAAGGFDDIVKYLLEKGADASLTWGTFLQCPEHHCVFWSIRHYPNLE